MDSNFALFKARPWIDWNKLILFILALVIISSPKLDFLYPILDPHSLDIARRINLPQVNNIDAVNSVLWLGGGYCLSLAICYCFLILWDLNAFGYHAKRISDKISYPAEDAKFKEFFYIRNPEFSIVDGLSYLKTARFVERLMGLAFCMLTILFIGSWSYWWLWLSIASSTVFGTIVLLNRNVDTNKTSLIVRQLVDDFLDILSIIFPNASRSSSRSGGVPKL